MTFIGSFMRPGGVFDAKLIALPAARERCRALARDRHTLETVGNPRYDRVYRQVASR